MTRTTWLGTGWPGLALGLLLLGPMAGPTADRFQGTVVDASSGVPIASATVWLVDASGERRAGAFTDADGHFSLSAFPRAGDELHAERLGFAPLVHAFEADVEPGADRMEFRLRTRPFDLAAIEVVSDSPCEPDPEGGDLTQELWEAARTGLRAAELSESEGLVLYQARNWERHETGTREVLEVFSQEARQVSGQPFRTVPARDLAEVGYITETPEGDITAFGPGAKALLSEEFIATHCFRWLDRASGELRSIEFEYQQWIPLLERWVAWQQDSGGRIDYRVLDDGRWVIEEWFIRILAGFEDGEGVYMVAGGELVEVLPGG